MILLLKNLLFTVLVPGTVGACLPLLIAGDRVAVASPVVAGLAIALLVGLLCGATKASTRRLE